MIFHVTVRYLYKDNAKGVKYCLNMSEVNIYKPVDSIFYIILFFITKTTI